MTKHLLAGLAFALAAGQATAADLPVRPGPYYPPPPVFVYQWTGCYGGINAGYGWGKAELTHTPTGLWPVLAPLDVPYLVSYGSPTLTYGGVEAGGHVGCNYQIGAFVGGIEADVEYLRAVGARTFDGNTGVGATGIYSQENRVGWLSTVRARAGGAFDRTFLYVTAGVAFGQTSLSQSVFFNSGAFVGSTAAGSIDQSNVGWVVGLGGENALTNNWLLRVEYLYVDLGRITANLFNPSFPAYTHEVTVVNRVSIARVGISYKFGGPVYPTYAAY